jgi:hypothetical protein
MGFVADRYPDTFEQRYLFVSVSPNPVPEVPCSAEMLIWCIGRRGFAWSLHGAHLLCQ